MKKSNKYSLLKGIERARKLNTPESYEKLREAESKVLDFIKTRIL